MKRERLEKKCAPELDKSMKKSKYRVKSAGSGGIISIHHKKKTF